MEGRLEDIIQKQEALIKALQEQHAADQELLDSQKQMVQLLQERIALLEKENNCRLRVKDWKGCVQSSRSCWILFPGFFQSCKDFYGEDIPDARTV